MLNLRGNQPQPPAYPNTPGVTATRIPSPAMTPDKPAFEPPPDDRLLPHEIAHIRNVLATFFHHLAPPSEAEQRKLNAPSYDQLLAEHEARQAEISETVNFT